MTAADGLYLLIYGSLAFGLAITAVLGFGVFLHADNKFGQWITPLFAPLMLLGIAAGSLLSGRNLNLASLNIESISSQSDGGSSGIVLRLISFVLVGLAGAKIFGWLMHRERRVASGGAALFVALVAYFTTTVVLNSAFGSYPAFIHNNYYFLIIASALYLARAECLDATVDFAKTSLLFFLVASLLVAVAMPSIAVQPSYTGWIPSLSIRLWGLGSNPNSIGPLALLFLLLLYMHPYARKWLQFIGLGAALLVLVLAQSKTAWIAGAAAGSVLFWYRVGRQPNGSISASFLLLLVVTIASCTLATLFIDPVDIWKRIAQTQAGSDIQTLTGRAQIWAAAIDAWLTNPIFGYGPTAWGIEHRYQIGMPFAFNAHNQFLQSLSTSGLLGVLALIAYLFILGIGSWNAVSQTRGVSLALFTVVITRTFTEAPLTIATLLNGDALTHVILFTIALRGLAHKQGTASVIPQNKTQHFRQVGL